MKTRYNRFSIPIKASDRKENISVIILSDESSKGMKQFGPKSLLTYDNDIVLNHQLAVLQKVIPEAEIIIAVGFESQKIINNKTCEFRIVENVNFEETSCIETIRLCLNNITKNKVLIIPGDIIMSVEELNEIIKHNCIVTNNNISQNNIGIIEQDGVVTNFAYGLEMKWTQIINLGKEELIEMRKYVNNQKNKKNLFHHAVEYIMQKGFQFKVLSNLCFKIERGYSENINTDE